MTQSEPPSAPRAILLSFSLRAGIAMILAAATIHVAARHYWNVRLPPGWSWESVFVGVATAPDPATGEFPKLDSTAIYERKLWVSDESGRPDSVTVTDSYINRDPHTGQKLFDYTRRTRVDPRTARHLTPGHTADYFVFPRNVRKTTYRIRNSYLIGTPFRFEREQEIEGELTYVFRYAGAMEYTDFYRGTAEAPGIRIPAGQEVRCLHDQFEQTFWVEPVTGMVVKLVERCHSEDVLMDVGGGPVRGRVLRWSAETSGNDVVARVEEAWWLRWRMMVTSRFIPAVLMVFGAILVLVGIRNGIRLQRGEGVE